MDAHTDRELIIEWQKSWQNYQKLHENKEIPFQPSPSVDPAPLSGRDMMMVSLNLDKFFNKKPLNETASNPDQGGKPVTADDSDEVDMPIVKKIKQSDFENNPTHFASLGDDWGAHITGNFTDGDKLRKLNALKLTLHELGDELGRAMATGTAEDEERLMSEIQKFRAKVNELSNSIQPDPISEPN